MSEKKLNWVMCQLSIIDLLEGYRIGDTCPVVYYSIIQGIGARWYLFEHIFCEYLRSIPMYTQTYDDLESAKARAEEMEANK